MSLLVPESLRNLQELTLSNFQFEEDFSKSLAEDLNASVDEDKITLVVNSTRFDAVYKNIAERLVSQHMTIHKLRHVLLSNNLEEMAASIIYIVLCELIHPKSLTKEISLMRSKIYGNLSQHFTLLRKDLRPTPTNLADNFLEFWCAAVCSILFSLILDPSRNEELHNNIFFVTRVEHEVRSILISSSSSNMMTFHDLVLGLVPYRLIELIPTDVTCNNSEVYANPCSERHPKRARLFTPSLLQSISTPRARVRPINMQVKTRLPSEKADKVVQSVNQMVGKHKIKTQQSLNVIRLYERDYKYSPNMTSEEALAVSFDSFIPQTYDGSYKAPESYKKSNLPKRLKKVDIDKINQILDSALINLHGVLEGRDEVVI